MIYLHYDHYVSLDMVCYVTYIYMYIYIYTCVFAAQIACPQNSLLGCLRPSTLRSSWQRWPWQSCPSDVSVSFWAPFCWSSQFLGPDPPDPPNPPNLLRLVGWEQKHGENRGDVLRDRGKWDDSLCLTANYMGYMGWCWRRGQILCSDCGGCC